MASPSENPDARRVRARGSQEVALESSKGRPGGRTRRVLERAVRPVPLVCLRILVLQRDLRRVLETLGSLGVMHLVVAAPEPGTVPGRREGLGAERERWESLRTRVGTLWESLGGRGPAVPGGAGEAGEAGEAGTRCGPRNGEGTRRETSWSECDRALAAMEERIREWARRGEALERDQARLDVLLEESAPWRRLRLPLADLARSPFLRLWVGTLPERSRGREPAALRHGVVLWWDAREKGGLTVVVAAAAGDSGAVERELGDAGFQAVAWPVRAGMEPGELHGRRERDRARGDETLGRWRVEGEALRAGTVAALIDLERQIETELALLEASVGCFRTETTVTLTGWVEAAGRPGMEERVRARTSGRCVVALAEASEAGNGGSGEPTLMRSPRGLRPFDLLVEAYGLPVPRELVPTLFVALSYPVMFGLMFGDVGHGAILLLAGLVMAGWGRVPGRWRPVGWLLGVAGLVSMGFGWVYGSCFGVPGFRSRALWHDPLEADPTVLILGAMGIGVVMISLGLVLNILNRLRRGDVAGAVLDKFGLAGLGFYWGALAWILLPAGVRESLPGWGLPVWLGLTLVAWTLREPWARWGRCSGGMGGEEAGRSGEGWASVLAESLVGTFEGVLLFLANTVSFVRLAAYALSHAALLMATVGVAVEVERSVGPAASVLVMVLGNLVTLVLEGIVASVQALRLEYYEFFGKFFSGEGRPFRPFRLPAAVPEAT